MPGSHYCHHYLISSNNGNSSVFARIVDFRKGLEQGENSRAVFSVVVVLVDDVIPVQVS